MKWETLAALCFLSAVMLGAYWALPIPLVEALERIGKDFIGAALLLR